MIFFCRVVKWLQVISVVVFFSYIFIFLRSSAVSIPFQNDEISWFFHTKFFKQLFINKDLDNRFWTSYESYDHPQLSKFIFGGYLWMKDKKVFVTRDALEKQWGRWNFYFNPKLSDIQTTSFAPYIRIMREVNVVCVFITLIALSLLFFILFKQWLLSMLLPVFLIHNPIFINSLLRATSDVHMMIFDVLSVLVYVYYLRNKSRWLLILFSFFAALAVSAKLTGFIVILVFIYFELIQFCFSQKYTINLFIRMGSVIGGIFIFWLLFNPALYSNPIQHSIEYFSFRNRQSAILQHFFPEIALINTPKKVQAVFCTLLKPQCGNQFEKGYLTSSFFVNVSLFLLGIVSLTMRMLQRNKNQEYQFISLYFFLSIVVIGLYLPLNSDRYFIPMQISIFLVQFAGIGLIIEFILAKLNPVFKRRGLRQSPRDAWGKILN